MYKTNIFALAFESTELSFQNVEGGANILAEDQEVGQEKKEYFFFYMELHTFCFLFCLRRSVR